MVGDHGATRRSRGVKKPGSPGFFQQRVRLVQRLDIRRLVALGAGRDIERNLLVFTQALEAAA